MNRIDMGLVIDEEGLSKVIADIIVACYEKAEYIRKNNQGEWQAQIWERNAAALEKALTVINYE